ncbi:hypothetical protein [Pseudoalteromonas rhizosphaerae]|jgi:hypothetical protein|uniref:hypothetical protein n=1 Tax=Pseudoalteromonas rhizosphaerae TaxID=2518973 RepID=UPI0021472DF1|nr:hypothetical protein [Pseudoalteromonas rhizosphaerae]
MAIIALIVSSFLGALLLGSVYDFFSEKTDMGVLGWFFAFLVPLGVIINLFVAYKIFRGSLRFIKFAFWIYVLQIIGFETPHLGFSITLGFSFNITWSVYDVSIIFNLFAILMSVILYKAMCNANET